MELNELKVIWKNHHQKAREKITVNKELLLSASISQIKSGLLEFKTLAIIELVINSIFITYLVSFIIGIWNQWEFSIPAMVLWLLLAVDLVWNIFIVKETSFLNLGLSIVDIQKKINRLVLYRRYEVRSLYLAIPLFAVCFVIVLPKALFDFSIYPYLGEQWYLHILGTLAITPLIVWFINLFPDRKMLEAREFLDEVVRFEKEELVNENLL